MKKESQQGKLPTEIDLQIDNILFININWFLDMWYIFEIFGSSVWVAEMQLTYILLQAVMYYII